MIRGLTFLLSALILGSLLGCSKEGDGPAGPVATEAPAPKGGGQAAGTVKASMFPGATHTLDAGEKLK